MTEQGYERRIWAIEWWCTLSYKEGGYPWDLCEKIRQGCSEVVDADFYGESRVPIEDQDLIFAIGKFDDLFNQTSLMPSGKMNEFIPSKEYFS